MSPRTLPANHKAIRKQKRRAQEQADRDKAPMAVVQLDGVVFVRPLGRALHCCEKHKDAQMLGEFYPQEES